jgi:hypothetical protein
MRVLLHKGGSFLTQTAEPAQQMGGAAELRGPLDVWESSMQVAEEPVGRRPVLAHGGGRQGHGKCLDMNFQDLVETGRRKLMTLAECSAKCVSGRFVRIHARRLEVQAARKA